MTEPHDPWSTPQLLAFRAAARACLEAGEKFRELKDILATEEFLLEQEREKLSAEAWQSDFADPTN